MIQIKMNVMKFQSYNFIDQICHELIRFIEKSNYLLDCKKSQAADMPELGISDDLNEHSFTYKSISHWDRSFALFQACI